MGFFSQDCEYCGHPLLCASATQGNNKWMTQGVVILPSGSIIMGHYSGYGELDDCRCVGVLGMENTVYHKACWEHIGKPSEHKGASRISKDQGWFFDDHAHNWETPEEARANLNVNPWTGEKLEVK